MSGEVPRACRRTIEVNGVELSVVELGGGGPALLFLHYWGGSSRTWSLVIDHLAATHRCIALDFRGWGDSSKDALDHGLETLADDVVALVHELRLDRYSLVGHSMGGKVAQLVAARHPAELERVILCAPAPPAPLDIPEAERLAYIDLYQSRAGAERVVHNLTPHPLKPVHREWVIEDTLRGAPAAKRAWPEEGMIADVTDAAARIAVPVHVIVGADDPVEPEMRLREAFRAVLPRARFHVITGVGHMAPLEAPAALALAIRCMHQE